MSIILVWVVQRAPLALNYVQGFNELSRLVGGAFAGVFGLAARTSLDSS